MIATSVGSSAVASSSLLFCRLFMILELLIYPMSLIDYSYLNVFLVVGPLRSGYLPSLEQVHEVLLIFKN